jgi:hypothetical protein
MNPQRGRKNKPQESPQKPKTSHATYRRKAR